MQYLIIVAIVDSMEPKAVRYEMEVRVQDMMVSKGQFLILLNCQEAPAHSSVSISTNLESDQDHRSSSSSYSPSYFSE